jgi:Cu(I)/Ag(I) efflux system membrane fusion protein
MKTNYKKILKIVGILTLGVFLGWLLFGGSSVKEQEEHVHEDSELNTTWTCSMHPQIKRNEPGDCPICGMDLIPMDGMSSQAEQVNYQMSESAMKLANIQTMIVGKEQVSRKIRLNGKVEIDERNSYTQSTHIPGRIEKLNINFTGEKVRKGQNIATIYSPDLVTAQVELLQAYGMKASQPELFEAAVEKLKRWKIGKAQIDKILENGKALESFPIQADINGVVTQKMVELGDYVERGMPIYEITDLSKVWVMFDLYEDELEWVKEGTEIEYTVNSLPGQTFIGKISFIDPLLNSQTRVASARVEVSNKNGQLKPEMFVVGVVNVQQKLESQTIAIPRSAVLWTGERSVIYVKENGSFKMREVKLGAAMGDSYTINGGLEVGEEIVSNGTFTLDAAVQLSGRASMMNPDQGNNANQSNLEETTPIKLGNNEKESLKPIYNAYFQLKEYLAEDNFDQALKSGTTMREQVNKVNSDVFSEELTPIWQEYKKRLSSSLEHIHHQQDIASLRENFREVSNLLIKLVRQSGPINYDVYVQHCPMANNDKGADWLSKSDSIKNPYYGSAMLTCGEVKETITQ